VTGLLFHRHFPLQLSGNCRDEQEEIGGMGAPHTTNQPELCKSNFIVLAESARNYKINKRALCFISIIEEARKMKLRNIFLLLCILSIFIIPESAATASSTSITTGTDMPNVAFREAISGLTQPVFITHAGDGTNRLFIVERAGRIRIYKKSLLLSTPFLDITSIVNSASSEQGLLALAFHPDYTTNGLFYTVHIALDNSIVLSSFTRSATDPDQTDPGTRVTLQSIPKSRLNHNGGTLAFGPDGYLYWSIGDGGGGGDPDDNAQDLTTLLGKILRLDVDSATPYAIPASNPFYGNSDPSIRQEIWTSGLRNPWRMSFDRLTNDLYIGDVGQNEWEEIDFQPASSTGGENYGWRCYEGNHPYNTTGCLPQSSYVAPVAEYNHTIIEHDDNGCSVTGGYVYRGSSYPELEGVYFYGDYCSGKIWGLQKGPSDSWIESFIADTAFRINSFGEDEQGEMYLIDYAKGKVYQIIILAAPITTTPNGAINEIQPTYAWGESMGATDYDLYVYSYGTASYGISETYLPSSSICSSGTCTYTPAVPLPAGDYKFKVRARAGSSYSDFSLWRNFSVSLGIPSPSAPSGTINTATPAFQWDVTPGATSYRLAVYSYSASSYLILDTVPASYCDASQCTYPSPTSLSNGDYKFKVLAYTPVGTTPYSDWLAFTISGVTLPPPPYPPTPIAPNGTATTHRPTFQWSAVEYAAFYRLAVYSYASASYLILENVYPSCVASVCSFTHSTIDLPNGNYKFKVLARNSSGMTPYSSWMNFTVSSNLPVAPTLIAPSGIASANPPEFQWSAVSGATQYRLAVYSYVTGNYIIITNISTTACSGTVCTYTPPSALASGDYKFKMLTYNSYGISGYSDWMRFSVP